MNNIYEIKKLYALIIYCDNYLENHYRLRVFNTLNQAKNFCKKTFKTPNGQYEFFEVNKGRFAFYTGFLYIQNKIAHSQSRKSFATL